MSEKLKECCKTSKKFLFMVSIVFLTSILVTLSWNGYNDEVGKIVTFILYLIALTGIGLLGFLTFYAYGKFCGIFRVKKYVQDDDFDEGRIYIGMGCLVLPIALVITLNHTAQNIDYLIRGLSFN